MLLQTHSKLPYPHPIECNMAIDFGPQCQFPLQMPPTVGRNHFPLRYLCMVKGRELQEILIWEFVINTYFLLIRS